jgi:hypothetical protein
MRVALAACLILCAGCDFVPVPLPTASATLNSIRLDLPRGSYCWSSGGHSTCADSAGPDLLLEKHYLRPYQTAGGIEVTFAFQSKSRLRDFRVELVKSPTGAGPVRTTASKSFTLRSGPPGIYVYVLTGVWSEGDVGFYLPIDLVPGVA